MDLIVGRVLDGLEELGLAEDTLVLFVGDNGTHRAITSVWRGGEVRGGKSHLRAAGTHVPMIVRWPGTVAPAVLDDSSPLVDFAPTLAELCGLDLGARWPVTDGASRRASAASPEIARLDLLALRSALERARARPGRAVYDGRFKLHHDGELFDVLADRDERAPLPRTPSLSFAPGSAPCWTRCRLGSAGEARR